MHPLKLIGVIVPIVGILDIVIVVFVVAPRLKMPAKTKKILVLANTISGLSMIILGAVLFFVGASASGG